MRILLPIVCAFFIFVVWSYVLIPEKIPGPQLQTYLEAIYDGTITKMYHVPNTREFRFLMCTGGMYVIVITHRLRRSDMFVITDHEYLRHESAGECKIGGMVCH